MFLFKKIVSQFFFPMPLCLFLCFTGLALLWWTKRQKTGKVLVTSGLLLLTALSYEPVANALLRPLENKYPPYIRTDGSTVKYKYVVVLGGGHNSDPALPITSQIGDETLKRLVEGIRVYRDNPGSKLVLSGGSWLDPIADAEIMARNASFLGVPKDDIILESDSRDTEDQARLLKPLLTTNAFVLVTSASHMPRSMRLFWREGTLPRPAPTSHLIKRLPVAPSLFFPRSQPLRHSEQTVYEMLGILWTTIGDRAHH